MGDATVRGQYEAKEDYLLCVTLRVCRWAEFFRMIVQVGEQALFLRFAAFSHANVANGRWANQDGIMSRDSLVDGMPGLLDRGYRDSQFIGEVLVRSAQKRGEQ